MSSAPLPATTGSPRGSAVRSAQARLVTRLRRAEPGERTWLAVLVAVAGILLYGSLRFGPAVVPPVLQTLPLLTGGLLLGRRALRRLLLVVAGCLVVAVVQMRWDVRPVALVSVFATAVVAYEFARRREETGLGGLRSDTVLVELRRRLEQQGRLPQLPAGWRAEVVVRPAGGGPFAGDFVVSACPTPDRLEIALVDVSGKGVDAGTRALLLSGALGGLLGSQRTEDFLRAGNAYLVRSDWDEGFATAVHLVVDLVTGDYALTSGGHPPVALFDAGSGRWSLLPGDGLALGLLPDAEYEPVRGRLDRGDALLLYTDGLVETPGRDLSVGIDKLLGEADRLVPRGFAGGAEILVDRVAAGAPDDRGLVLLWRCA